MIEHFFTCPYCAAEISMLLDMGSANQTYIEDCEVCCRPIEVTYQMDGDQVEAFDARSIEQ